MKISIVCPYYNEEAIIEGAVRHMLLSLSQLPYEWELIVVNDGSTDRGPDIVREISSSASRLISVGYPVNVGRGYALQTGINAATGDIIVTTEIDCSWGDTIVAQLVEKLITDPLVDFVIASPNLSGGGYRNVPFKRILLSRIGNMVLRTFFTNSVTMNTGMTRAYRRTVIQGRDFDEKGKEFHLEVLLKLLSLGYRVAEVPAILEWKDDKFSPTGSPARKSSSKTGKLIGSHLQFAIFANPIRYFWALSILCAFGGIGAEVYAVFRMIKNEVAVFVALIGLLLLLFSLLFFAFGVVTSQNRYIMKELWRKH